MSSHDRVHWRKKRDSLPLMEEYVDDMVLAELAARMANPKAKADPQQMTVTSYHYVTLSPTFTGAIAGYTTPGVAAQSTIQASATVQPTTVAPPPSTSTSTDQAQKSAVVSSTGLPSSILSPSNTIVATGPLLAASSTSQAKTSSTTTVSASSATASNSLDSTGSGEMATGTKAGIAIGVIMLVGAIAIAIFFCINHRRKKASHERLEDEKHERSNDIFAVKRTSAGTSRTAKTASTAPRLSLRPVTQFLPGFSGNQDNRRTSRGNALYPQVGPGAVQMTPQQRTAPAQSAWERPMNSDNYNQANPFGNHAEAVDPVNAAGPAIVESPTEDVVAAVDAGSPKGQNPGPDSAAEAAVVAGAAGAVGAAAVAGAIVATGLVRGASKRGNGPKPLDFTKTLSDVGPPSPAGTDFSFNEAPGTPVPTGGAAAIAAAGGPQNSAVHRVQLDFKPSMEDELELRAGQLVRLLHEYDDGWALCIRLDRSQQGVCPRTCLSTRPVKPRPANGPRGQNMPPGMRGSPQQGRPMSSAMGMGQRSGSPAPGRPNGPQFSPHGRPASPAGGRSSPAGGRSSPAMGPYGPQGRPMGSRSNSPSPAQMHDRQNTPPRSTGTPQGSPPTANAPIGRKPVPGQAM